MTARTFAHFSPFHVIVALVIGVGVEARAAGAPPVLYHWTSMENLKALSQILLGPVRTLPPINSNSFLVRVYPELKGKRALFAWSHPVGGVGSKSREIYGNNEALVRIQLDPAARVLKLNSARYAVDLVADKPWLGFDDRYVKDQLPPDLGRYDVIFYTFSTQDDAAGLGKTRLYKEWIILNPSAIRDVTADPDVLRPVVAAEITKLKDPKFKYRRADIHSVWTKKKLSLFDGNPDPKSDDRQRTIERLEAYVASRRQAFVETMPHPPAPGAPGEANPICENLL